MDNMFECDYCGALSDSGARKCGGCGAPFTKKSAPFPQGGGVGTGGGYDGVNQPQVAPSYGKGTGGTRNTPQGGDGFPQTVRGDFQSGQGVPVPDISPYWPVRDKTVAGILAILLGGLGVQFFYLGRPVHGILCILFSLTLIPTLIGIVTGIIYLCQSDCNFQLENRVRVR